MGGGTGRDRDGNSPGNVVVNTIAAPIADEVEPCGSERHGKVESVQEPEES